MIDAQAVLSAIADILTHELDTDPTTPITSEMGALIRDRGMTRALSAAALRRALGEFHDLARCADFTRGPHRRRLR